MGKRKRHSMASSPGIHSDPIPEISALASPTSKPVHITKKQKLKARITELETRVTQQADRILSLEQQLERFKSGLVCTICVDYYCAPYAITCGHAFCYDCLSGWFNTLEVGHRQELEQEQREERDEVQAELDDLEDSHSNEAAVRSRASMTCPICRTKVTSCPVRNLALEQQVRCVVNKLPSEDDRKAYYLRQTRTEAMIKRDTNDGSLQLWAEMFPRGAVRDKEDGVRRCMECLWEIVGSRCVNCGAGFSDEDDIGDDVFNRLSEEEDVPNEYAPTDHEFSDEFSDNMNSDCGPDDFGSNESDWVDYSDEDGSLRTTRFVQDEASEEEDEAEFTHSSDSDAPIYITDSDLEGGDFNRQPKRLRVVSSSEEEEIEVVDQTGQHLMRDQEISCELESTSSGSDESDEEAKVRAFLNLFP